VCDAYEIILIKVGMMITKSSSGEDFDWRQWILPCGSQVDLGVCTLLLGLPWRRLEPWRDKCGDRFHGMRPGGYLETSECSWNSWSHGSLRLTVRPVLDPKRGRGAAEGLLSREGAHYLGLYMHVGNERPLVGVLLRFGTLAVTMLVLIMDCGYIGNPFPWWSHNHAQG
jgi:hypothetical protein